jgi:hypothetical protein
MIENEPQSLNDWTPDIENGFFSKTPGELKIVGSLCDRDLFFADVYDSKGRRVAFNVWGKPAKEYAEFGQ